ncbi:MAG: hypothetical protein GYB24_05540 [Rhodobacteraceae bacterium]|nr:hypothetical protein [Paracoccaceae bacterium]
MVLPEKGAVFILRIDFPEEQFSTQTDSLATLVLSFGAPLKPVGYVLPAASTNGEIT